MNCQNRQLDAELMTRAIRLAARGRGSVEPNPMVGCVIVKNGSVIGEGYHHAFGEAHAEANALAACSQDPRGATVYVTLEPCRHQQKKTPPCVPRLIAAGIARVVVACVDPNPLVNGQGIDDLRRAGVAVDDGVLRDQAMQLNAPYFKLTQFARPYVTLKWAQSADGKVAGPGGRRLAISGPAAWHAVHLLRSRCDAVAIGIGTAINDDPLLTPRGVPIARNPLRIVLDRDLRLPPSSRLPRSTDQGPVRIYCSSKTHSRPAALTPFTSLGVQITPLPLDSSGELSLTHLLDDLVRQRLTHLLVEPGPTLARSFLSQKLADRVWIIRSPLKIDDPSAPPAATIDFPACTEIALGQDRLSEYFNPGGVFFSAGPSADLMNL